MRKDNVWKQAIALVLSAALVLGNASPVSAAAGDTAAGDGGAATEGTGGASYEALTFDFEDGQWEVTGDNAKYSENSIVFTGSKSIKIVDAPIITGDDAQRGKVLQFSDSRSATIKINDIDEPTVTGTASLTTAAGELSKYDFSNGVTFSMDICPDRAQTDWSYLFGFGTFSGADAHYVTGTIGFTAAFGAPWEPFFPHQYWQEGNTVSNNYLYFYQNINQWHHVDYVYTEDGLTVKVDGVPAVAYKPDKEKMKTILKEMNKGQLRLGQGPDLNNEGFLGYIDNVTVTPVAPHSEHVYTEADIIEHYDATCTADGMTKATCSICGGIVEITIPKLPHTYGTPVPAKAATCTEAGNKKYCQCTACNRYFVYDENGKETPASPNRVPQEAATGHDYTSTVSKKATDAADGQITKTCKNDSTHTTTEVIAKASNISLEQPSYIYTGKAIEPKVTVKDSAGKDIDASNYKVTYANNTNVGTGTATITFNSDKYEGSVPKTFKIEEAASLTLSKSKVTLYTGKASNTTTVKATKVTGASKNVSWTSDKPKVAKVDSKGKITAFGKGTANIKATANGITQVVKVTVKNPTITVKNGKKAVKKNTVTVKKKKSVKLTVSTNPKNAGTSVKKLSKKDAKTASVTFKKGKLTIKGKKKGTIKVKITSGKTTKTITVKVK